ncbi:unnamed protein product, partial [Ectocarpus sp. 4 AP-2014]
MCDNYGSVEERQMKPTSLTRCMIAPDHYPLGYRDTHVNTHRRDHYLQPLSARFSEINTQTHTHLVFTRAETDVFSLVSRLARSMLTIKTYTYAASHTRTLYKTLGCVEIRSRANTSRRSAWRYFIVCVCVARRVLLSVEERGYTHNTHAQHACGKTFFIERLAFVPPKHLCPPPP